MIITGVAETVVELGKLAGLGNTVQLRKNALHGVEGVYSVAVSSGGYRKAWASF